MTDAVQAGRGLVDYPGLYPNETGTVVANISGVTAIPGPITLAALAAAMGSTSYQGTWNAATNTPTLASSAGTNGYYYVVSVAGTTTLNGISDWTVGDWAIYNGNVSAWQKVEGGATTMTVGTTTVTGGTSGRVLYDNAGVLGEMTNTGTGTVSVLQTSPALITPILGAATGTTLALGGATIGSDTLAVSGTASFGGAVLVGDAANILAQRNSTSAQTFRIYNTYTDASNYERLTLGYNTGSGVYYVGTEAAGTGTGRYLSLIANGSVGLTLYPTASAVNFWQFNPTATGSGSVTKYITGGDTNISEYTATKGSGSHNFSVGGSSSNLALRVDGTTTAPVNWAYIRGSATLNAVQYTVAGTDADIGINVTAKGVGNLTLTGGGATGQTAITGGGTSLDVTSNSINMYRNGSSNSTTLNVSGTSLTSTAQLFTRLTPTINQTVAPAAGTYTVLDINPTETSIGAGPHYLIKGRIGGGGNVFSVQNSGDVTGRTFTGTTYVRVSGVVFASLPAAAGAGAGAMAYITDATATTWRSVAAGGGANKAMVWSDGTNWLIFG